MIIPPIVISIFKPLLIAFVISRFEPKNYILDNIVATLNSYKTKTTTILSIILLTFYLLIDCLKCTTFWLSLLITNNIYLAAISFIIAFIYDRYLSVWERPKTIKLNNGNT